MSEQVQLPTNKKEFEERYQQVFGFPPTTTKDGLEKHLVRFTPADWARLVETSNVWPGAVRVELWAQRGDLDFDHLLRVVNDATAVNVTASVAPPSAMKRAQLKGVFTIVEALTKISCWLLKRLGGSWG